MTGSDNLDEFSVVLSQDVIWGDMDAFQHVNNAVYFRYFEDARIAYFEKAGMLESAKQTGLGPILASARCDFRAPLTFPDQIRIGVKVEEVKEKKFTMRFAVESLSLGKLVAEGEGLVVFYDYNQQKSCRITDSIINHINDIES